MPAEMKVRAAVEKKPNVLKGLLAGALGGLAGSFAMSQFYSLLPQPASQGRSEDSTAGEDPTVKVASALSRKVFCHELDDREKTIAGPAVHYGFGMAVGSIYGALAERLEPRRTGMGLPFGVAVWFGAHVIAVPVLGLSEPVTQSSLHQEAPEFAAHLLYGFAVEGVRGLLRTA